MTATSNIFDVSTSEDVVSFSSQITTLMNLHPKLSANIIYVILHFHATQMMEDIRLQAAKRLKDKETPNV